MPKYEVRLKTSHVPNDWVLWEGNLVDLEQVNKSISYAKDYYKQYLNYIRVIEITFKVINEEEIRYD